MLGLFLEWLRNWQLLKKGSAPWVSESYTQSAGLLGRGISPSQGRYLHTQQHKHRINAHKHPCLEWDSNPRSQCSSWRRQSTRPLCSTNVTLQFYLRVGYTVCFGQNYHPIETNDTEPSEQRLLASNVNRVPICHGGTVCNSSCKSGDSIFRTTSSRQPFFRMWASGSWHHVVL
jgi:hypothetical protein